MRTAEASCDLVKLGEGRGGRLPERLNPLEAIAWIATRDPRFVSGVQCHLANVTALLRRGGALEVELEGHGYEAVKAGLEVAYCRCERPLAKPSAVQRWSELREAERELGRSGKDAKLAWRYELAHRRHCICFQNAEAELFAAASLGDLVATGIRRGLNETVCRTQWRGQRYDPSSGLILVSAGWVSVTFGTADLKALWPEGWAPTAPRPTRRPGRPRASQVPYEVFRERRVAGIPELSSRLAEYQQCVEEAARRGCSGLAAPKTYALRHAAESKSACTSKL